MPACVAIAPNNTDIEITRNFRIMGKINPQVIEKRRIRLMRVSMLINILSKHHEFMFIESKPIFTSCIIPPILFQTNS